MCSNNFDDLMKGDFTIDWPLFRFECAWAQLEPLRDRFSKDNYDLINCVFEEMREFLEHNPW